MKDKNYIFRLFFVLVFKSGFYSALNEAAPFYFFLLKKTKVELISETAISAIADEDIIALQPKLKSAIAVSLLMLFYHYNTK